MRAFNDKAVEQALDDCGLTLTPSDFSHGQLTELLRDYFVLSNQRGLEERWLE